MSTRNRVKAKGALCLFLHRRCASQGFTLVELLSVLVIIAVLSLLVLPVYRQALLKGNRASGRGLVMDVLLRQEQYRIDHKRYAPSLSDLGLPLDYFVDAAANRVDEKLARFRIELIIEKGSFRGARAVPWNIQARDKDCMTLSADVDGRRWASGVRGQTGECW